MKKVIPILIFVMITIQLTFIELRAQTWNIGYPDSTKVTATLDGDKLFISGTGNMKSSPGCKTWQDKIVFVRIKNGVTNIGEFAFHDCSRLKNVVIPNSVTVVKRNAFQGCKSLNSIIIPNNVIKIDEYAFFESFKLKNVKLKGKRLNKIGENAFRACHSLTSIHLPKNLTKLGDVAFRECYNLGKIKVKSGNLSYRSINGVLFNKNQDTLIAYPNGKEGGYTIPNRVSVIGNSTFACAKINSVSISNSVKVIEGDAFRYCNNLKSIVIPNGVSEIGILAFANCDSLIDITLGSGITNTNEYFVSQSNSLLTINVDKNNLKFSSYEGVLYNKSRDTLVMYPRGKKGRFVIPNNVKCVKKGAFEACEELDAITIAETVITIEDLAFQYDRNLKNVTNLSTTPQTISNEVFSNVKLENLTLFVPNDVIDKYKNAEVWKEFGSIKAIE